jgi:hypothetical protein
MIANTYTLPAASAQLASPSMAIFTGEMMWNPRSA